MTNATKTLIVRKGDEEFTVPLDKERVVVGREEGCDLVLDDRSISRQHLAVVFRYGAVYVENLSPTGYLEKNGQQTEYSELQPGDEIKFGPYTLSLGGGAESSDFLYSPPGASESESKMSLEGSNRPQGFGPLDDGKTNISLPSKHVDAELVSNSQKNSSIDADLPIGGPVLTNNRSKFNLEIGSDAEKIAGEALETGSFKGEENTHTGAENISPKTGEESYRPPESPKTQAANASLMSIGTPISADFPATGTGVSHASTKIVGGDPRPRLRITKSEEVGREIKLEAGSSWVLGRSKRSGIVINHPSISRQHFKIVKIQDKYRIQDLGSSRGVKVNGVNVTDSPLNPFDTILAGKVEMQFLLVDEALAHMSSSELLGDQKGQSMVGMTLGIGGTSGMATIGNNETQPQINLPAIQGFTPAPENAKFNASNVQAPPDLSGVESTGDSDIEDDEGSKVSILVKIRNMPPRQRMLAIGAVVAVFVAVIAIGLMGGEEIPNVPTPSLPVAKTPNIPKPVNPNNVANPSAGAASSAGDSTIDPKFFNMSRSDREQIETWYAEVEIALRAQDWNKVISRGSDILAKLEKYKSTQDFVLQAQSELGTIGATNADAGMNVEEKVAALLQNAREALDKQEWESAETNATKVLNIAPDNTEALDLIQAAKSKGAVSKANLGTNQDIAPPTPEDPEKQEQFDYLAALTAQYRQASDYLRAGEYSRAMPVLVDLDDKIYEKIQEHRSGRQPAAYTQELIGEMQALGDQVKSSYDAATSKLNSEYSTQLQDASAFVQNRQYIQAREVYDSILVKEPYFDDAKKARLKLYDQIIIEARRLYQEALISESIGDLKSATDNLQKTVELLTNVKDIKAIEYYQKSRERMQRLQR